MIRHTVVFKLKHSEGSKQELHFLQSAKKLSEIPTVRNFESLRQISEKNVYDFGLSMEFAIDFGLTLKQYKNIYFETGKVYK